MKSLKGDAWLAIVVIVGAAVYLYLDLQLPEVRLSDPLGPKAFPALVGVGLISSALLLLFEGHSKARHAAHANRQSVKEIEANEPPEQATQKAVLEAEAQTSATLHGHAPGAVIDRQDIDPPTKAADADNAKQKHPRAVLIGMVLWTAAYYFSFDRAGYLLATSVFLLGLLSYFNRKRHKTNLAIAIGIALVLDLLFSQLLGVPMPQGILPF